MTEPIRRKDDRDDRDDRGEQGAEAAPSLDRAGGVSREELNPQRSGDRPVQQNDRSRDRELEDPLQP